MNGILPSLMEQSWLATMLSWNVLDCNQAWPSCPSSTFPGAEHPSHPEVRAWAPAGQATRL